MFGIDQISWGAFIRGGLLALLLWYLALLVRHYFNRLGHKEKLLFEDDYSETSEPEVFQPTVIASADFPSRMMKIASIKEIPLSVSFFEEVGLDEGYKLDRLLDSEHPLPPTTIEQIRNQYESYKILNHENS